MTYIYIYIYDIVLEKTTTYVCYDLWLKLRKRKKINYFEFEFELYIIRPESYDSLPYGKLLSTQIFYILPAFMISFKLCI